jgi:hypothetical protein
VFNLLSHYCSSSPRRTTGIRAENRFYGLQFFTRSMPCITELHSLFYINGVKIVPHNIYDLLTPIALAHVIMGDGSISRHGLRRPTPGFAFSLWFSFATQGKPKAGVGGPYVLILIHVKMLSD